MMYVFLLLLGITLGSILSVIVIHELQKRYIKKMEEQHKLENKKPIPDKVIKSPDCISEDGVHTLEYIDDDPIFAARCENCFEQWVLVSETALKQTGIHVVTKDKKDE